MSALDLAPSDAAMIEAAASDPELLRAQYVERAKGWLNQANEIESVKEFKSRADAIRVYVTQKELGHDAELAAGRTCDCAGTDANVPDDQRGNDYAVCPACGLTVEVIHQGRYAPHNMIVDGLEGWEETLRAAQEGGMLAVRRINERARIQAMSAEYRGQKRSAS